VSASSGHQGALSNTRMRTTTHSGCSSSASPRSRTRASCDHELALQLSQPTCDEGGVSGSRPRRHGLALALGPSSFATAVARGARARGRARLAGRRAKTRSNTAPRDATVQSGSRDPAHPWSSSGVYACGERRVETNVHQQGDLGQHPGSEVSRCCLSSKSTQVNLREVHEVVAAGVGSRSL
jgi:hypothetical protein